MPDETPAVSDEAQAELDAQKKTEEEAAAAKVKEEEEAEAKKKAEAKSFDQSYVDSIRSESAKYRKRAQDAEEQVKKHDDYSTFGDWTALYGPAHFDHDHDEEE